MGAGTHKVALKVGGLLIENWTEYEIESDILTPADGFSMRIGPLEPADALMSFGNVYDTVEPDAEVQVLVDDVLMMSGFIDERAATMDGGGDAITISGRDRCGRLVDESMPLVSFAGPADLAKKVAGDWFETVRLTNDVNRFMAAGGTKGAKVGRPVAEPFTVIAAGARGALAGSRAGAPILAALRGAGISGLTGAAGGGSFVDWEHKFAPLMKLFPRRSHVWSRKVEPGESRWATLEFFLRESGLMAWSTVDGKTLIIGRPNYSQEPTYTFFHPSDGSARAAEGNVLSLEIRDSLANCYSQITATGAFVKADTSRILRSNFVGGDDAFTAAYKAAVTGATKCRGVAKNGPGANGIGKDFAHRKTLLINDDGVPNTKQALERAKREMAERDAGKRELTIETYGHGQQANGAPRSTLFVPDTVAHVEDEVTGIRERFYVTSVRLAKSRGGERATLRLVPLGVELRA